MKVKHNKTGSVLIEAMVGLSLIILSFGGIISLVSRGFQLNSDTMNKFVAVNLSAEGIELVKAYLDTEDIGGVLGWENIDTGMYEIDYTCSDITTGDCKYYNSTSARSATTLKRSNNGTYSYSGTENTTFKRSVVVIHDTEETVEVYSIIRWDNRGTENEVQISNTFKRWRKDQNAK